MSQTRSCSGVIYSAKAPGRSLAEQAIKSVSFRSLGVVHRDGKPSRILDFKLTALQIAGHAGTDLKTRIARAPERLGHVNFLAGKVRSHNTLGLLGDRFGHVEGIDGIECYGMDFDEQLSVLRFRGRYIQYGSSTVCCGQDQCLHIAERFRDDWTKGRSCRIGICT